MFRPWFVLIGVCLGLLGPSLVHAETRLLEEDKAPLLLVLGDSLSSAYGMEVKQGWVSLLELRLRERQPAWRVVNASISGETTRGGLARLPGLLERFQPQIVVIELGANDGLRGTPLAVIRKQLRALIMQSKQAGARVVLVGNHLPPNFGKRYAQGFFGLFQEVAEAEGVDLVPFLLASVATKSEWMQDDGLHPRAEAQGQIMQTVWSKLDDSLSFGSEM